MPSKPSLASDPRTADTANARLLQTLHFLQFRLNGISIHSAARALSVPQGTLYRHARGFLAHGLAGIGPRSKKDEPHRSAPFEFSDRRANATAKERLPHIVKYLLHRRQGVPAYQAAAGLPFSQRTLHGLGDRLLRRGLDGLAPDWRSRGRWKRELCEFEVTPEILGAVEQLAGKYQGDVRAAWKRYGRSPQCPFRLAVRLGKKGPVPHSFIRAIRLERTKARAWRGASGRIYINVAGKKLNLGTNANTAKQT